MFTNRICYYMRTQTHLVICYFLHQIHFLCFYMYIKVQWSRYRPDVAQRMGRGIALLFHDRGTRRRWVVSSTPQPHFTPGKDPVPILQEDGWSPELVWTSGKSRPYRDSIPDCQACTQSLYWLSYPVQTPTHTYTHTHTHTHKHIYIYMYEFIIYLNSFITTSV